VDITLFGSGISEKDDIHYSENMELNPRRISLLIGTTETECVLPKIH
jgi:hypothetical protein